MSIKTAILAIDLQNDFTLPSGSLYVDGAEKDMDRFVSFIAKNQSNIDYVALTLDSHQPIHIAHQIYWKNAEGKLPELYTNIKSEDILSEKWMPQYHKDEALEYLLSLEDQGGVCTIWPMHCILGTEGWALNKQLTDGLSDWCISNDKSYELFYKGYAQNTEHYSIFRAAVEYSEQPETQLNESLLNTLNRFERLIIAGQAADFCVANSLNDILLENEDLAKKVVMLTDCMSYIIKNNPTAIEIFDNAKNLGVQFVKSTNYSF